MIEIVLFFECLVFSVIGLSRQEPTQSFKTTSTGKNLLTNGLSILLQEFTTSMYLRQEWTDRRLAHGLEGSLPVKGKDTEDIWRPDTYFTNNNDYKLYEDNQLALISKYGSVYYSAR